MNDQRSPESLPVTLCSFQSFIEMLTAPPCAEQEFDLHRPPMLVELPKMLAVGASHTYILRTKYRQLNW